MTPRPLPARARNRSRAIRFATALLALLLLSTGTAYARRSGPIATTASTLPSALRLAASASARADRRLVTSARTLAGLPSCPPGVPRRLRRGALGAPARREPPRGGRQALARIVHAGHAQTAGFHPNRIAPALAILGTRLSWSRVGRMNTYVVSRRAPGQPTEYSIVAGTSTTPAPAPGASVAYSVRTTAPGSLWARSRAIAYPAPIPVPTPTPTPTPTPGPEVPTCRLRRRSPSAAQSLQLERGRRRQRLRPGRQGSRPGGQLLGGCGHHRHPRRRTRSERALQRAHRGSGERLGNRSRDLLPGDAPGAGAARGNAPAGARHLPGRHQLRLGL